MVGCYARHPVVNEASVIPVDPAVPPEAACLTGCGAATGWGSAVYADGVRPGDDVAVVGVGGLGSAAVGRADLMDDIIPRLLGLYSDGLLDLDGMVTRTYPLEDINAGYQDMRDGKNIRGVLLMPDLCAYITRYFPHPQVLRYERGHLPADCRIGT
jgi:Zn-dependent alcohol dehydrogenase